MAGAGFVAELGDTSSPRVAVVDHDGGLTGVVEQRGR